MNAGGWRDQRIVHVCLVLLVFTCTGLTVARLGIYFTQWAGIERFSLAYWLIWIFGLLPLYNLVLLGYAFLFGKYQFFRQKQLRTWRFMTKWLRKP